MKVFKYAFVIGITVLLFFALNHFFDIKVSIITITSILIGAYVGNKHINKSS